MSLHLSAKKGEIASTVLLPGDPLRAKFIAETYFDSPKCHNEVRGMLGYTGTRNGTPISVQGTGMGMPSISIYLNELIKDYDAQILVRVGTCGSIQPDISLGDVIIAMTASSDSGINKGIFNGHDFAPSADPHLFSKAVGLAEKKGLSYRAGGIFTTDQFYLEGKIYEPVWAEFGHLALDMETSALYSLALRNRVKALSILTVSDNLITHEHASQRERETSFNKMIELALEVVR